MSDSRSQCTDNDVPCTPRRATVASGITRACGALLTAGLQRAAGHAEVCTRIPVDTSLAIIRWATHTISMLRTAASLVSRSGLAVIYGLLSAVARLYDLTCAIRHGAITRMRYRRIITITISRSVCSGFAFAATGLSTGGQATAIKSMR